MKNYTLKERTQNRSTDGIIEQVQKRQLVWHQHVQVMEGSTFIKRINKIVATKEEKRRQAEF